MSKTGKLYVVATPIGNLSDITPRMESALREADFIAAEDTRVTAKILNHLGIKKPMISYHQHNTRERGDDIIGRILAGETCALCCDAGTPGISDPGEALVRQAHEACIVPVPIPGPCAAITALCASGIATGRFVFEGFIPVPRNSRRERLAEVREEKLTMVFYEAPHKLRRTLDDLLETLGDRQLTLARELTKLHEEITRTTLAQAVEVYKTRDPKGEYVLVVAGKPEPPAQEPTSEDALAIVRAGVERGLPLAEACKQAAARTGQKKSELYKLALEMRNSEA
ncbi:MAG: 16S rRNA (cytidine(1402)-2'-O)-methyltransferase [Oscillospiraceae bacterium]|nr:16S rRNA (cytidine(1402)-2'-O)-methyltransferase [Oscillospiraceae bacterium]